MTLMLPAPAKESNPRRRRRRRKNAVGRAVLRVLGVVGVLLLSGGGADFWRHYRGVQRAPSPPPRRCLWCR